MQHSGEKEAGHGCKSDGFRVEPKKFALGSNTTLGHYR
jgi:hypothetical protein